MATDTKWHKKWTKNIILPDSFLAQSEPSTSRVWFSQESFIPMCQQRSILALKYPKVYLSLKTFKSRIEHSSFFPFSPFCSEMTPWSYKPPITEQYDPFVYLFSDFLISIVSMQKDRAKNGFVNAANFSQRVILFKGISLKDYNDTACTVHYTNCKKKFKSLSWALKTAISISFETWFVLDRGINIM